MNILDNLNEIGNDIKNNFNLENIQNDFLKTNIGQITNAAVDIGIRALLPDLIENEVIEVKDALISGGLNEGIEKAIDGALDVGKKILGISDKEFESLEQAQEALKKGDIVGCISKGIDVVIGGLSNNKIITKDFSNIIKSGKNIIFNNVDTNISNEFEQEKKALNKLEKYINNWEKYYSNKDLEGLNKEYKKIEKQMKNVLPLGNIIKNVNKIENINNLINNSENFDFNEVYLELANQF